MYKNLKTLEVECLENGDYQLYRETFSGKTTFLKWIPEPENCKNQENRIQSKKINGTVKLCTLATNNLIVSCH